MIWSQATADEHMGTMTDVDAIPMSAPSLPAQPIPTFALQITGWKRRVFDKFFPDRQFVYLPFGLTDTVFDAVWKPRILSMPGAEIFVWGQNVPAAVGRFADESGMKCYYIEDGFLRSNRPNAARTPPLSLTFDRQRAYFDSRGPSDLEDLLQGDDFLLSPNLLERARKGIGLIVDGGLSKYNSANTRTLADVAGPKTGPRVLVLGQVEDDASIRFGCDRPITNNDMVRIAAAENPDAQIIYKPHPDVLSGARDAQSDPADVEHLCVVVRQNVPLARSFDGVDKVYAITSLAGFEALMRGIPVVVLGCPFYAGWGLTDDRQPNPRRTARRSVEEVFAAAYLIYSRYFDPKTGTAMTFEEAVDWLKIRLAEPLRYEHELVDYAPPKWALFGAYGIFGWRLLLPFFVAPIVGRIGNKRDVREYRENPIRYFRDLTSPRLRLVGRILYPFDPRR